MLIYPDNKILTPVEKDIVNFCLRVCGARERGVKEEREGGRE